MGTAAQEDLGESQRLDPGARKIAVSVVIPCRDAAGTLPELLDSLCRQRFEGEWEVVAVENGSTDETRAVLERYADRLPLRIVTLAATSTKPSQARNFGVAESRGDVVLFADADDVMDEAWGSALQRALAEHGFVGCRVDDVRLNDETWRRARSYQPEGLLSWWDYPYPCAAGGAIAVRRTLFDAVGGMDEELYAFEDVDFCWKVQQDLGVPLTYVPEAVVYYRYRTSLRGVFRQARAYGAGMVDIYGRYRSRGLPVPPHQWTAGFWAWARGVASVIRVRDRGDLGAWLWRVGGLIGLVEGSAKRRRLLLCADPPMGQSPFKRRVATG